MPKATVDEHCDFLAGKNNVCLTTQPFQGLRVLAEPKSQPMQ